MEKEHHCTSKYYWILFTIILSLCVVQIPKAYACCVQLTVSCPDDSCTADQIPITGTIYNCGSRDLVDVTIEDAEGNLLDFLPSVAVGATETFSGLYTPGSSTLTVVATGTNTAQTPFTETATDECTIEECGGCRMTGGGNRTAGLAKDLVSYDGTVAKGKLLDGNGINLYTFGGQAGASTALQPQPSGEWTHHQMRGVDGSFVFHMGTKSAPPGTEIDLIQCSDPGWCVQAREAPFKQLDFEGVGTFHSIKKSSDSLVRDAGAIAGETFHWAEVHIEDLGEPGGKNGLVDGADCPEIGADGLNGINADCGCEDFYRITIYAPFDPAGPPNKTEIIYMVDGRLIGGNFQIHPLTGKDSH